MLYKDVRKVVFIFLKNERVLDMMNQYTPVPEIFSQWGSHRVCDTEVYQ